MTTVLRPPPTLRGQDRASPGRVAPALARVEGRRLVRHPLFLAGVGLGVAAFVVGTWDQAPVLHRDDTLTGMALLPVAAGTFLAANLAALRSRRHRTEETYGALAAGPGTRTLGHLLSVGWAVAAALAFVGWALLYLSALGPVGVPSPVELLTGPAIVALAGTLGVAVARWVPSPVGGPVGLVALAALQVTMQAVLRVTERFNPRWLGPWVAISAAGGNPAPELVIRPRGWHLAYLVALAALAGAGATLRHGVALRRVAVGAAALALAVVAGTVQTLPPSPEALDRVADLVLHPRRVCRERDGVRYCAYPAYAPWIDRWARPVSGVLAMVPPPHRPAGLQVVQELSVSYGGDLPPGSPAERGGAQAAAPTTVVPGTSWGRGARAGRDELGMALLVAGWSVGLPPTLAGRLSQADIDRFVEGLPPEVPAEERAVVRQQLEEDPSGMACSARDQARAVVALWLAGRSTPGAGEALRAAVRANPMGVQVFSESTTGEGGVTVTGWTYSGPHLYELETYEFAPPSGAILRWGHAEAAYAVQLLDRPAGRVARAVRRHWDRLTDPRAPSSLAVRLLGLRPVPTLERQLADLGLDPAQARGLEQSDDTIPCP